jgi:hypothetical protein
LPRINHFDAAIPEIHDITGREFGTAHLSDGRNLRIRVADRSAQCACAAILEKTRAASLSKPIIRPARSSANMASAAASSRSRRIYSGIRRGERLGSGETEPLASQM